MLSCVHNKKVALITVHVGPNFGSVLQTIATCEVFKRLGLDTVVVNYIPERVTYKRACKDALQSVKKMVVLPARLLNWYVNNKVYGGFLKKHSIISEAIYAKDDFQKKCPPADFYVTGSDQVWNSIHNEGIDTHYFWEGINGIKIAYSSSIGKILDSEEEIESFKKFLSLFDAISVREQSACDELAKIGIHSEVLLDPTFMLNKEQWKPFISKRLVKEPYLFVYLPYNIVDKSIIYSSVRRVARSRRLKVITFSRDISHDRMADKTILYANPGDFMSLMYYADYVFTNSFHGTAFSINLNKQFSVFMPSHFSTRIDNILGICDLKDRLLDGSEVAEFWNQIIDYTRPNEVLERKRNETISFLKKSFQTE